jgi:endonuclease/exonuclease/phosphatase family metal-dependent hydrolase
MLTVMTLNLNFYVSKHGSWNERKKLITKAIMQANPDIVAFQAAASDPEVADGKNQVRQLAELLPAYPHHVYQVAKTDPSGKAEGMGLLSRIPVGEVQHFKLSRQTGIEDPFDRILLKARFDLTSGPFYLFNAHFSWVEAQALDNVTEAFRHIQAITGNTLLVGDLNSAPESAPMQQFREQGWVDAWELLHPGEEGFTFESNHLFTRIDYAWAQAGLKEKIHSVQLSKLEQSPDVRLSDHLGLVVSLDI